MFVLWKLPSSLNVSANPVIGTVRQKSLLASDTLRLSLRQGRKGRAKNTVQQINVLQIFRCLRGQNLISFKRLIGHK